MSSNKNIDGYALIAICPDGKKSMCTDYHFYDVRLQDLECYQLEDELTPEGLKDCLVMVFFNYMSIRSGGLEYDEYEDCFIPAYHAYIKGNYKEFWREQISIQVTSHGYADFPTINMTEDNEQWAYDMIENWESLYDEVFEIHPRWLKESEQDRIDESNAKLLLNLTN